MWRQAPDHGQRDGKDADLGDPIAEGDVVVVGRDRQRKKPDSQPDGGHDHGVGGHRGQRPAHGSQGRPANLCAAGERYGDRERNEHRGQLRLAEGAGHDLRTKDQQATGHDPCGERTE